MALSLSQIAEFFPVDTRNSSGTILLPTASAIPGRVITFKDMYGTFSFSSLTLSTQGNNFFEGSTSQMILRDTYGYLTFVSDGLSQWNMIDGTSLLNYTISTTQTSIEFNAVNISTNISTSILSTFGMRVSTIGFEDQITNQNIPLFASSSLLYYGNLVVAGSKAASSQFLPVSPF